MRRSHFFVESSRFFSSISVWSFTSAAVRSVLRKQIARLKVGGARIFSYIKPSLSSRTQQLDAPPKLMEQIVRADNPALDL